MSDPTTLLAPGSVSRVEAARVRGTEPTAAFAPTGASGERDFLAERLALFARIACLASTGFLLMRFVIKAVAKARARARRARLPGEGP